MQRIDSIEKDLQKTGTDKASLSIVHTDHEERNTYLQMTGKQTHGDNRFIKKRFSQQIQDKDKGKAAAAVVCIQDQRKDQQDQQQQDQKNQDQGDQQGQQESKISPQAAKQILQAMQAKERETQDKVEKKKAAALKSKQKEKNW